MTARCLTLHSLGGHVVSRHFYQIHNGVTHTGTDFEADIGTPVIATANGVVLLHWEWTTSMDGTSGYGIQSSAFHSFYAHLSATAVSPAPAGCARPAHRQHFPEHGNTTGPHLHYEIRLGDEQGYAPYTQIPQGCVEPETFFCDG